MKAKIYTFETCPYCIKAKQLLNDNNISFEEVVITRDELGELSKETGQKTVPQVFLNDTLIGGCDDLQKLIESNEISNYE